MALNKTLAASPALPFPPRCFLPPHLLLSLYHTQEVPKPFPPLQHRAKDEEEEEEEEDEGEAVCRRAARAGTAVGIWLMEHPA